MFCDDKDSQENAKQIQNQWDKLSESDKVRNITFITSSKLLSNWVVETNYRLEFGWNQGSTDKNRLFIH